MRHDTRYILTALIACALTLFLVWGAAHGEEATMYALCRPSSQVNIRKEPRTSSEYCGYLLTGDSVTVSDYRKDNRGRTWCKVIGLTEYGEGWVCEAYLAGTAVVEDGRTYTVQGNGRVAARSGIGGKRTGWVKPGQSVKVYAHSQGWVITNKGYIQMDYLETDDD